MSDQPPMPPMTSDFPDHWGFYLLQAVNRLEDNTTQAFKQLDMKIDQRVDALDAKFTAAIQKLDTKIDDVRRDQDRTAGALRQDIHALDIKFTTAIQELDHKIDQKVDGLDDKIQALDTKVDQKLTGLQYWYWGTLVVIIVGFVTIFLSHT